MKCELSCCLDVEEPLLSDVTATVVQLMGFLRDHGVGDAVFLGEFELAAAEAINNAVEHGCSSTENKFFHARLYLRHEYVELRVLDPSSFAGWESPPELPDDPLDEGGRGHYLMTMMTDEILHTEENGRHVIILRKHFKSGPWEYLPGHADQIMQETTDELVSSYEMISTLLGLGEWLATASDFDAFTAGALEKLCEVTQAEFAYVRLLEEGELLLAKQHGESLAAPDPALSPTSAGLEAEVFRSGQEVTLAMGNSLSPHDPLARKLDSGFIAPVLFKDRREGILVLGRTQPATFFDAGNLKIARVVAEYLGIVHVMHKLQSHRVAEKRALRDLEIAAKIQLSLMPQEINNLPGLDICGRCQPALQAGGDYFDVLQLPDGAVLLLIADVMGKGLSAALLATMLRTNLRCIVSDGNSDPGAIVTKANHLMFADLIKLEMFITLSCAWVAPDRSMVRSVGAGHLPGLLQRAPHRATPTESSWVEISGTGMPLGIFADSNYTSTSFVLSPGDKFLLITDGILEATSPDGAFFEMEGVRQALAATHEKEAVHAVEGLLQDVAAFTKGSPPSDDRTVLLFRRTI
jgi:serine phosphatase RsbU (regulator of sigma subunit)/anti-sigma regulatory factor (Ser/Thr protein kinase)